ncbi:lipid-A-disaccharide synthase [Zavarzinia sp. CC-PAN008]|uniref:lipid-A-disaccharide synthase n=1 Tax=Zavarzinia sp. CC-PAN008 TaxID=3243332 RepID=UPI003F7467B7
MAPPLHIMILAGEPSGDLLGARLMRALKVECAARGQDLRFSGVGGEAMQAAGLIPFFPLSDLAVMGIVEVLPRAPRILRRVRELAAWARRERPDAIVTIDSWAFSLRVARAVAELGIPRIHYVAPMVWVWRAGRAKVLASAYEHLLTLLPFEPPLFEKWGLASTFVGHSALEDRPTPAARAAMAEDFRARHGLAAETPLVALMPGSRRSEVAKLGPLLGATLDLMRRRVPNLVAVVPTVDTVRATVEDLVAGWPIRPILATTQAERQAAMAASTVAIAKSGTSSLELALLGVPHLVTYRASPLSIWLLRRMTTVTQASLINILSNSTVIPELLQERATPELLAAEALRLLTDSAAAEAQRLATEAAVASLGNGATPPSALAARTVLDVLAGRGKGEESASGALTGIGN